MSNSDIKSNAKTQLDGRIFSNNWIVALLVTVLCSALISFGNVIPVLGSLLILGPISYGQGKLFLIQARDGQSMNVGGLFDGFTEDFGGTFLIGLMTAIYTFLWGLLFVIPGIVKQYAYSMVYFIKADHPSYDWRQCIDESVTMMKGHKMKLFLLDLSFIGWYILGALCFGIGALWVNAWHEASRAQFYEALKGYGCDF